MSASLSRDEVVHVAKLARLALTDGEIDRLTGDLAGILAHVQEMAALDLAGVETTAHPLGLVNVLRADVPRASLDRAEVLAMAPAAEAEQFRVPRILGDAP